jgi:hypothetical protein
MFFLLQLAVLAAISGFAQAFAPPPQPPPAYRFSSGALGLPLDGFIRVRKSLGKRLFYVIRLEGGGGSVEAVMDRSFPSALARDFGDDQSSGGRNQPPTAESLAAQVPNNVKEEIQTSTNDSDSDDTSRGGDDKEGGFHEEGGDWGTNSKGEVVSERWKPGPKADPTSENPYIIPFDDAKPEQDLKYQGDWHVHPSGTKTDLHRSCHFKQEPTDDDRHRAGDHGGGIHIVVGAGDREVYFYGKSKKLLGKMSLRAFTKPRKSYPGV